MEYENSGVKVLKFVYSFNFVLSVLFPFVFHQSKKNRDKYTLVSVTHKTTSCRHENHWL